MTLEFDLMWPFLDRNRAQKMDQNQNQQIFSSHSGGATQIRIIPQKRSQSRPIAVPIVAVRANKDVSIVFSTSAPSF